MAISSTSSIKFLNPGPASNSLCAGAKNVMVITSTSPVMGVTKDDGKSKPAVMKAYDYGMLGTDRKNISIYLYSYSFSLPG
jgi:hypothetical protein